jgi:two-component system nitrogen regulation sensor histidine kinase GlnL
MGVASVVQNSDGSRATVPWENILTSLDDGVIITDIRGRVSFVNQSAEILVGLSAKKMLHKEYTGVLPNMEWLTNMIAKSLGPNEVTSRADGELPTRRTKPIPVGAVVSPLQDQQGHTVGSVLVLRDRTLSQEMAEDLRRSDRLALLGTLSAGLAHEIKNPLGGIRGAAQLLKAELPQDPSLIENTEIMIREVDRVNELLEQLLDLARPAKLRLEPLNIHELLNHVLGLEGNSGEANEIRIERVYDPSLPPILGDRTQLTQVFLNLVKNASQAMSGQGCLTLTTRIETDFSLRARGQQKAKLARIDFQDNGPGIEDIDLPHIFSPFFTTKQTGTGLGLAICDRVIKEHGGHIRVDSQPGQGALFRVSLALVQSS